MLVKVILHILFFHTFMAEEKKSGIGPLVVGAAVGVTIAAVALSKEENRKKAKNIVTNVVRKGKKLMERPEAQALVKNVTKKSLGNVVDKAFDKGDQEKDEKAQKN